MKRRLLTLCLCLLLGAAVNVLVAWECACYASPEGSPNKPIASQPGLPQWAHMTSCDVSGWGYSAREIFGHNDAGEERSFRFESGWPCKALARTMERVWAPGALPPRTVWYGTPTAISEGVQLPFRLGTAALVVPVSPLPLGFTANTVLYSFGWYTIMRIPYRTRRTLRRRRSLCPACAYPVGTSTVCSECGTPLRTTTPEPR